MCVLPYRLLAPLIGDLLISAAETAEVLMCRLSRPSCPPLTAELSPIETSASHTHPQKSKLCEFHRSELAIKDLQPLSASSL